MSDREALVKECRASGMTAKVWCEAKGLDYRRYLSWATKLNKQEEQSGKQRWADVTVKQEEDTTGEIKLNCGKWIISVGTGFSPTLLAEVLRVVDEIC